MQGEETQHLKLVLLQMSAVTGDKSLLLFDPQFISSFRGLEGVGLSGFSGELVKMHVTRPHFQRFICSRSGTGPRRPHFSTCLVCRGTPLEESLARTHGPGQFLLIQNPTVQGTKTG